MRSRTTSRRAKLGLWLAAALATAWTARASEAHEDLFALYVYEQAAELCGLPLSEDEEMELDDAQQRARLRLGLSRPEAAHLYRKARATALSSKERLCAGDRDPDLAAAIQALAARSRADASPQSLTRRSRAAFPITLTDDSAIAAAAMIGDSRMPRNG
jgi:hypothetical protein